MIENGRQDPRPETTRPNNILWKLLVIYAIGTTLISGGVETKRIADGKFGESGSISETNSGSPIGSEDDLVLIGTAVGHAAMAIFAVPEAKKHRSNNS